MKAPSDDDVSVLAFKVPAVDIQISGYLAPVVLEIFPGFRQQNFIPWLPHCHTDCTSSSCTALLYRIEEASVEEILTYLRRIWRVYLILLALTVLSIILFPVNLVWSITTVILYVINIFSVFLLIKRPCVSFTFLPMISASLLAMLDTADMIYQIVVEKEWEALLRLIAISIQLSTIFIAYKLREKMNNAPPPMDDIEGGRRGQVVEAQVVANPVVLGIATNGAVGLSPSGKR
eukprot:gene11353-12680_t